MKKRTNLSIFKLTKSTKGTVTMLLSFLLLPISLLHFRGVFNLLVADFIVILLVRITPCKV